LGESDAMREVRASIARLARSMAPVAITGESGSGKELAARLVHESGTRATMPFVAVNCGAIPETLMEAEFFGYRKGAFTGAEQDRDGFFQAASGGTLFLDEVADLPLPMQVKLLRAIQEKRVRKVGATAEEPVDVRIISATHQDLGQCVAAGRFRQDLYYRLNVIELKLPPLRDRPGDIPALAQSILEKLAARGGLAEPPRLSSVTLKYLCSYGFPGNVRELENILERAAALCDGEVIRGEDLVLPQATTPVASGSAPSADTVHADPALPLPDYLEAIERQRIVQALERTRWNRTAAAELLGVSFRTLRYRLKKLGIE
ncbi:MAG TPA: sigma-54 dependent transcriptional regulator, partial [Gammaproteobacteria bacterium]